ncbi:AMB1 [Auxenochlorella protothecoides x Auxenochlorella symbiontica]
MWDCRLGSNLAAGPSNRCSAAAWNLRPQVQRRQRDVGPCCSVASETVNRPGDTAPSPPAPATLRSTFAKPDSELQSLLRRVYAGRSCSVAAPSRDAAAAAPRRAPVPVYVMLPLDTVWLLERDGGAQPVLIREKAMAVGLEMLSAAGVSGVMVDVWWGIVEHAGPRRYDWSAYRRLFDAVAAKGLRIQAVMSFHAAGGNVGDTCTIPLPRWVVKAGEADPDIFYTDAHGARNRECLSLGCDEAPVLAGRTPVAAYRDFAAAFAAEFRDLLGSGITEITLGLGPAGELRYPSYPEGDGRWRFPGVGEFQCHAPPPASHPATSASHQTTTPLDASASTLLRFRPAAALGVKLAGVHWWYTTRAHAAELTAGVYNTRQRDGYEGIMRVLARHGAAASFTCVEMRDCEHPAEAACSPEGLLGQVLAAAARAGVPLGGENALQRYDRAAFDKIAESAVGRSVLAGRLEKITFLRMGDMMVDNWDAFSSFLQRLTGPLC